jgi:hypothetical protein
MGGFFNVCLRIMTEQPLVQCYSTRWNQSRDPIHFEACKAPLFRFSLLQDAIAMTGSASGWHRYGQVTIPRNHLKAPSQA